MITASGGSERLVVGDLGEPWEKSAFPALQRERGVVVSVLAPAGEKSEIFALKVRPEKEKVS